MGLENGEPAFVTRKSDSDGVSVVNQPSNAFDANFDSDMSPRTREAISAISGSGRPISGTHHNPIAVDDVYEDPIIDDDMIMTPPPAVWQRTQSLMERMASLAAGDGDAFGLRIPMEGQEPSIPEGFVGSGKFEPMTISGTHKTSFLQLINQHTVVPENWRMSFPSRAMAASCPLHYPKERIEQAIQDAKEQKMFIAVHIFNNASDSSDFYNMIISRDDVQSIYAESFIPYFVSMDSAVELGAMSRLLSPSLQRRPPPLPLPAILFVATVKGRLNILGAVDSTSGTGEYVSKLILLRELYLPELRQEEQLEIARQQEARLIDEQNDDYEKAVRQDEERAQNEADAAAVAAAEEKEIQDAIEAATKYAEEMEKKQADSRASQRQGYIDGLNALSAEPTEGKNATIALRLTDGSKVQRKFNPDTTTLADIFAFAAGQIALKATDETFTLPSNTDLAWNIANFDLSAQFPARRFSHSQESQTLRQLGLVSQELLNLVENT